MIPPKTSTYYTMPAVISYRRFFCENKSMEQSLYMVNKNFILNSVKNKIYCIDYIQKNWYN